MRYLASIGLTLLLVSAAAQNCGQFHFFNFQDTVVDDWIWPNPRPGFSFDMYYDTLLTANTGYTSFYLISDQGDTISNVEYYRWSFYFPWVQGDTLSYTMVLDSSYSQLPQNFSGYLGTENPECEIPITFGPLVINEAPQLIPLELYPNPANEVLHISSEITLVKAFMLTINGKEIPLSVINSSLDLRSLPPGLYILKVVDDQGDSYQDLVVIKRD